MGWSERYERNTAVTASVSAQGFGVLLLFSVMARILTQRCCKGMTGECYGGGRCCDVCFGSLFSNG